jgi:hypothetical protein
MEQLRAFLNFRSLLALAVRIGGFAFYLQCFSMEPSEISNESISLMLKWGRLTWIISPKRSEVRELGLKSHLVQPFALACYGTHSNLVSSILGLFPPIENMKTVVSTAVH